MTVEDADDFAMPRQAGEQPLDMRPGVNQTALARSACRGPAGIETVRRVMAKSPTSRRSSAIRPMAWIASGRDRAGVSHHDLAVRAGLAQPIGAIDDRLAQSGRHRALDLLDRTRGQAQIDRAPGFVAQPGAFGRFALGILLGVALETQSNEKARIAASSSTKAGSNSRKAVLRDADQRLGDRLMRATFRRQRDARRRRHQDKARVLIAGVIERIEAAGDERVVERSDRNEPLAVDGMRQAERGQRDEQIISAI